MKKLLQMWAVYLLCWMILIVAVLVFAGVGWSRNHHYMPPPNPYRHHNLWNPTDPYYDFDYSYQEREDWMREQREIEDQKRIDDWNRQEEIEEEMQGIMDWEKENQRWEMEHRAPDGSYR